MEFHTLSYAATSPDLLRCVRFPKSIWPSEFERFSGRKLLHVSLSYRPLPGSFCEKARLFKPPRSPDGRIFGRFFSAFPSLSCMDLFSRPCIGGIKLLPAVVANVETEKGMRYSTPRIVFPAVSGFFFFFSSLPRKEIRLVITSAGVGVFFGLFAAIRA